MPDTQKTILLVEDEEDIRSVYSEVLREAGYKVIEASDGTVGLKLALSGVWDLLLLDIILPGMDGLGMLKRIKANDLNKSKPVVLLTNLGYEGTITQGFDLGASGYLIKSEITPDKILLEVQSYFSR